MLFTRESATKATKVKYTPSSSPRDGCINFRFTRKPICKSNSTWYFSLKNTREKKNKLVELINKYSREKSIGRNGSIYNLENYFETILLSRIDGSMFRPLNRNLQSSEGDAHEQPRGNFISSRDDRASFLRHRGERSSDFYLHDRDTY